uniref:Uncharacterized protein n=1 Tax=Vitis vinifera TaxID=29760 RepID=A5B4K0_VITVI|nr:hypothetical protein VITISV_011152 [Vitis vinifera]
MIRTTYPDRICYRPGSPDRRSTPHVLLGNSDGVDLDSLARSVSSGRGVRLRSIAHSTRGRILSGRLSTFSGHFISEILCADILHPDVSRAPTFYIRISHIRMGKEDVSASSVINFVNYSLNQRAPAGHESVETPIGNESNGAVAGESANFIVILFQGTCGFHHKFVNTSCVCQSGYEIVEEGLLNLKHLITRSWK